MKHFELFELIKPKQEVAEHLSRCKTSASKAIALAEFAHNALALEIIDNKKSDHCLSTDELCDIVEGTLIDDKKREHLKSCDYCFKEASYYYSQSIDMESAELSKTPTQFLKRVIDKHPVKTITKVDELNWSGLLAHLFKQPAPAFAVMLLLALFIFAENPSPHIKTLSGGESFKLFAPLPNKKPIYYFGKTGRQIGEIPAYIKATRGLVNIEFEWSRIEASKRSLVIIHDITSVAPRLIVQAEVEGNSIKVPFEKFNDGDKYKLLVAGNMKSEGYFKGELTFKFTD